MQSVINEQRIQYFYETVRAGSIRAAAAALDVSPSVISRQIKLLETELSATLLEKRGRNVIATESAQPVLEYYRKYQSNREDLISHLDELRGFTKGRIVIAAGEGFSDDLFMNALSSFMALHPDLEIQVDFVSVNEVIRRIQTDEAHLGLAVHSYFGADIVTRSSARKPICVVMNPEHPLNQVKAPIEIEQTMSYPLGFLHVGYGLRKTLQSLEAVNKIHFDPSLVANTISSLKSYVSATKNSLTFLPKFCIQKELESGQLVAKETNSEILNSCENHLITRVGRPLSPACQKLILLMSLRMNALKNE